MRIDVTWRRSGFSLTLLVNGLQLGFVVSYPLLSFFLENRRKGWGARRLWGICPGGRGQQLPRVPQFLHSCQYPALGTRAKPFLNSAGQLHAAQAVEVRVFGQAQLSPSAR